MSNRAATILATAAVMSLLCLYAAFAGAPTRARGATETGIAAGPPAVWLDHELPGRYRLAIPVDGSSQTEVIVFDTHTGQCWSKLEGLSSWRDWGSPVRER